MSKEENAQIRYNIWTLTFAAALVGSDYDTVVSESINYGDTERDQSLVSNDFKNTGNYGGIFYAVHAH